MKSKIGPMMNRRVRELVLISLLAAFCGGLAFAHDRQLFAAAFAAAAVVAGFAARRCVYPDAHLEMRQGARIILRSKEEPPSRS
jgi:hypothetical protein